MSVGEGGVYLFYDLRVGCREFVMCLESAFCFWL
jgi:hypothetical protein